jgi:hypothetical protein
VLKEMLKIEDFHALLISGKDGDPLLAGLRRLMLIERAEEIVAAISDAEQYWNA